MGMDNSTELDNYYNNRIHVVHYRGQITPRRNGVDFNIKFYRRRGIYYDRESKC